MNTIARLDAAEAPAHRVITPSILYVGTPVALITTCCPNGRTNISPMSSVWALGDRLVLGMSSAAQGAVNALRERELVINFPDPTLWQAVEALAPTTGASPVPGYKQAGGYVFEPDKFGRAGLTPQPSDLVRPDRILECPIQIEVELLAAHSPAGDQAAQAFGFHILETRALRVHARDDVTVSGSNHVDPARWSPLLYVFRHYFGTGADLGKTFKAEI